MSSSKKSAPLVLAYAGCSTCKKALAWMKARGVTPDVRPIVDEPPTRAELAEWVPASGVSVRKWLNTSGLSYRAIGKDAIDADTDAGIVKRLAADGKLVKRPVLVHGGKVAVGFKSEDWEKVLGG
jgi:arsenate reductase